MTISGVNISTYGLKVIRLTGYYGLPARKKVLTEPAHTANDKTYSERKIDIKLLGRGYATVTDLVQAVNDFVTLIKSEVVHEVTLVKHGEAFDAVFAGGAKVKVSGKIAQIDLRLTIQ